MIGKNNLSLVRDHGLTADGHRLRHDVVIGHEYQRRIFVHEVDDHE